MVLRDVFLLRVAIRRGLCVMTEEGKEEEEEEGRNRDM